MDDENIAECPRCGTLMPADETDCPGEKCVAFRKWADERLTDENGLPTVKGAEMMFDAMDRARAKREE